MKVFVYRNLRKKCYSIKALEGAMKGKVIAHASTVTLNECRFKVSKAGQARVRATKQKNVHAGVQGQWDGELDPSMPADVSVSLYYNPYKVDTFVTFLTHEPVEAAEKVYLGFTGVFADKLK